MEPLQNKHYKDIFSPSSSENWSSVPQFLGAAAVGLVTFISGLCLSTSAIIIPALKDASEEEISWLGSIHCLGIVFGSIAGCVYADILGRRLSIILDSVIFCSSSLILAFGKSIFILCIGKFIGGFAYGTLACSCFVFTAEISRAEIRGSIANINLLSMMIGISTLMLLGTIFDWRTAMLVITTPCFIAILSLLFIHESPVWLLRKNRYKEARASLMFYRGKAYNPEPELKEMQQSITNIQEQETLLYKIKMTRSALFYKPFSYLLTMMILLEWSSFATLLNYLVTIFQLTSSPMDPYTAGFIASLARVIGSFLASPVLHVCFRRRLYFISATVLLISLIGLATFCYLSQYHSVSHINFVPLVLIMIIYLCFSLGFGSCNVLLLGEILPPETRSLGNGVILAAQFTSSFLCSKLTPYLVSSVGVHGLFFIFSGVVFFQFVLAKIFMPETKGKTLTEIQQFYK